MGKRILRWRFIVDWKLQGSLCAHGLLYGGLVLVAVCVGIFAPLLWNLSGGDPSAALEDQAIVMIYMHDRFWLLALSCFFILVLGSIRFSHRIAGPLVRYKRNLRLVAAGKLPTPLRTRDGDYLKEEVVCLNEAVAGVAVRVDAIREAQAEVARAIHVLAARAPRQMAALLEPLAAANEHLERCVGAFEHHDTKDSRPVTGDEQRRPQLALAGTNGGS
ncbi:MAG: hypothetical protein JNK78_15790 [Planctomycetes bacterium]|nr:hypothetical protein [Planctomycetota bacterium]